MKKEIVAFLAVVFLVIMSCAQDNNILGTKTETEKPVLSASLVVGIEASPETDQVVTVGTRNNVYFAFKLASAEPQKVRSLKLTAIGKLGITTLENIKIREGSPSGNIIASAAQFDSCASQKCWITWNATDNIPTSPITASGTVFYVSADIAAAGVASLGDYFRFAIESDKDIGAQGASTGEKSEINGMPSASGITYIVPQDVTIEAVWPKAAVIIDALLGKVAPGQTVGVFKVTNYGGAPIYLSSPPENSFRLANAGVASKDISFSLFGSALGSQNNDVEAYAIGSSANGTSTAIDFDFSGVSSADRCINGGSWRYITIKTSGAVRKNDTVALYVSKLGSITYDVEESDLGYPGSPLLDNNLAGTIIGLRVRGLPSLATVTAK